MPTPTATLTSVTATGSVVSGPGAVTNLIKALPAACLGDVVNGPACNGPITVTTAVNKLALARPIANIGSIAAGPSAVGVPTATAVAATIGINEIV